MRFNLTENDIAALCGGKKARRRQRTESVKQPPLCAECGVYRSDPPSRLCPGCQAYREHQA